jgi:alpha-D-xyloside xylohydrolase
VFLVYEDDGNSFNYRQGEWMGLQMAWNDARKALSVRLASGGKVLGKRELKVKMGSETKRASFEGRAVEVRF